MEVPRLGLSLSNDECLRRPKIKKHHEVPLKESEVSTVTYLINLRFT